MSMNSTTASVTQLKVHEALRIDMYENDLPLALSMPSLFARYVTVLSRVSGPLRCAIACKVLLGSQKAACGVYAHLSTRLPTGSNDKGRKPEQTLQVKQGYDSLRKLLEGYA